MIRRPQSLTKVEDGEQPMGGVYRQWNFAFRFVTLSWKEEARNPEKDHRGARRAKVEEKY